MATNEDWEHVGEHLRERMARLMISKAELIERSGVSFKTLAGYLSGAPIRRIDKRRDLALALMWEPDAIDRILRNEMPIELGQADKRLPDDDALRRYLENRPIDFDDFFAGSVAIDDQDRGELLIGMILGRSLAELREYVVNLGDAVEVLLRREGLTREQFGLEQFESLIQEARRPVDLDALDAEGRRRVQARRREIDAMVAAEGDFALAADEGMPDEEPEDVSDLPRPGAMEPDPEGP